MPAPLKSFYSSLSPTEQDQFRSIYPTAQLTASEKQRCDQMGVKQEDYLTLKIAETMGKTWS